MKKLYFECASGISGDMTVASLLDLGADEAVLRKALDSLPLSGYGIEISRVSKSGLDCCDFNVILDAEHENHDHDMEYLHGHDHSHDDHNHHHAHDHSHGHSYEGDHEHHHEHSHEKGHEHYHEHSHEKDHEHYHVHACEADYGDHTHEHHHHDHSHEGEHTHAHDHHEHHHAHEHRGMHEVMDILAAADLSEGARKLAVKIFTILGEAEAKAHGTTLENVHFHEVGAVDSIVDIVGASVCLDNLGIQDVVIRELAEGHGMIRCQHGLLPIPVPAVANIVAAHGLDLQITETEGELVTPTGAAIAAAIRTEEKLPKHFKIVKTGLGAGKRVYDRPSILRVMILETTEGEEAESGTDAVAAPAEKEGTVKLETNIDDCSGEELGYVMDQLFDAGAKDVHYTPVFMKKNRPAYQLNVICKKDDVEKMEEIIFSETTTIGIRRFDLKRCELPREMKEVETELGKAMVKICSYKGMKKAYPEYDCVRQLAKENHKTFDQTFRIVKAAAEQLL